MANSKPKGVMRVHDRYERGDPAAPIGCVAELERDGCIVCTIHFPNEANEDIQEEFEAAATKLGFTLIRTHDADTDYGYW